MSGWIDDLRLAIRVLRRTRGTTFIALGTLALGAAGTTTLFSVIYAVLLRPLPFPDPDRLVMIWQHDPTRPAERISAHGKSASAWRWVPRAAKCRG
jgi:hypothetical protein